MHAAVVEGGAFVFVSFAGGQSGGHVADPDDGQVSDFTLVDEILDCLVVPGVPQIEVYRCEQGRGFGQFDGFPLSLHAVGDGFFGNDMLPGGERLFDLFQSRIREGEKSDDLYFGVVEDLLLVGDDFCFGRLFPGVFAGFLRGVADVGDLPFLAFLHLLEVETSHSAESDQTNFYRIHFVERNLVVQS